MVPVQSKALWMKKQQCPCGDWKCYISDERDTDGTKIRPQSVKNDSQTIENMVMPYVGMVFQSDDKAYEYYGNFARKNGFSVRKERSRLSPHLGIYRRDFVCYRSGFAPERKKQVAESQRDRKSLRCGCDAKMYMSKEVVDGVTQWCVVQFSNVHNHELLEDNQVRLLPAYRKICESDQERIILLSKAGFPINRIVKLLELEKGIQGAQLSFLERDVRNFIQSRKRVIQENDELLTGKRENDIVDLLEACRATKEADPFFAYDVSVSENDKVKNIAWSFGVSVKAYNIFGDVVYFDSSYRSMTYNMCLGAFLGINNHGKIIFFGCALLQDETPRSFAWALQAFLRFMNGRSPQTIITDIDRGIREAVISELPNAKHIISLHHILPRTSNWFSHVLGTKLPEFKYEFEELCTLESADDFEFQWNQMVSHFELNADKHIALLFPLRMCWALPYTWGCFLAQMSTVTYLKSVDILIKGVVNTYTSLRGLFEQTGLSSNRNTFSHEEAQYARLKTCLPIEEHARNVLTPYAFYILQQEMFLAMQYATSEMANGSYLVSHCKKGDGERVVIWIREDEQVHCSCKEFETAGILCRHALRVLLLKNCFQLPSRYILNRWCRENTAFYQGGQSNLEFNDEWHRDFYALSESLFSEAMLSKDRSEFVQRELRRVISQVRDLPGPGQVMMDVPL